MTSDASAQRNPLAVLSLLVLIVVASLVVHRIATNDGSGSPSEGDGTTSTTETAGSRLHAPGIVLDGRVIELLDHDPSSGHRYVVPTRFDRVELAFASAGPEGAQHAYEIRQTRVNPAGQSKPQGVLHHASASGHAWRKTIDLAASELGENAPEGASLRLEVSLYDGRFMPELQETFRQNRTRTWLDRRLDAYTLEIVRDRTPPLVETAIADGTRLNLQDAGSPLFAFQVLDEDLATVEVAGRAIDVAAATTSFDREGSRVSCFFVDWPRGEDGHAREDVALRVVDLAGWETALTLHYPNDPMAARPDESSSVRSEVTSSDEPSLNLVDWSDTDRHWIDPGYEHPNWNPISWHRVVTASQMASLVFEVSGIEGERWLVVEADPDVPPHEPLLTNARYVAPFDRRVVVRGPGTVARVMVPLLPGRPGATFLKPLHMRVTLWKVDEAATTAATDGKVKGAVLARAFLQVFRDDLAPVVEPAIASGTELAFAEGAPPILQFQVLEHFPRKLVLEGRDVTWERAADPIDPAVVEVAPRARSLNVVWPQDETGRPLREIHGEAEDRLGRRTAFLWSYPEDDSAWLVPPAVPFETGENLTVGPRARYLPMSGDRTPPWNWLAHNVNPEGELVPVRRQLTPFDTATIRILVDAEPGDYRMEVWQNSSVESRDRPHRDQIYDVQGGDVLDFTFDVSGIDGQAEAASPDMLRFVLFRREHVPNYGRPKRVEHPTEFDLMDYYARALSNLFVQVFQDRSDPDLVVAIPERTFVNPVPDPAWLRPHPNLRFKLLERFPWEVEINGVPYDAVERPRELDGLDIDRVSGEVGKRDHVIEVPWPVGDDGERRIAVRARDAFGRLAERTFTYVYDTRAPQLMTPIDGPLLTPAGTQSVTLLANERLLQAIWMDASGRRFDVPVEGDRITVNVGTLPDDARSGTLELLDAAGNAARFELEFRTG